MEVVVRATVLYWFLFLMVRGSGKRSLAELTPLDMIIMVVMGDIVQQGINQEDMSMTGSAIAVAVIVGWTLLGDWFSRRSPSAKRVLEGEPVIILRDGKLVTDALTRQRLNEGDVLAAAREQGYGDLAGIAIGVLEDDGAFSFIARPSA